MRDNEPPEQRIEDLPSGCLSHGSRRRRSTRSCKFTWTDIDAFNDERKLRRDERHIKVNSDRFLAHIRSIGDADARNQLYQFVVEALQQPGDFERRVVGGSTAAMKRSMLRIKTIHHLNKIGQVSGALNSGAFAKDTLLGLLNGNIKGVAVNLAQYAADRALFTLAVRAELKGATYLANSRFVVGGTLKAAAPFIKRLGSAFVVYDLIDQVRRLDAGDQDALIRVIGDSVLLGADALEIAGAIGGFSAFAGPVSMTIGAAVIIGTEGFFAVRHVRQLDAVLHLSGEQIVNEFILSIVQMPSAILQEEMDQKVANNQLAEHGLQYVSAAIRAGQRES